jgi:hypothetical protein
MDVELLATSERGEVVLDDTVDDGFLLTEALTKDGAPVGAPAGGAPLRLSWTTDAGWSEATATMVGTVRRQVVLWQIRFVGEPKLNQRREYARAPESLPVRLAVDGDKCRGTVRSLSEGGLLCVLDDWPSYEPGQQVVSEIVLEDRLVRLAGKILSMNGNDDGDCVLRVQFSEVGKTEGNLIRRRVLDQQRKARALGR